MKLESFVGGQWTAPGRDRIEIRGAVTGDVVAEASSGGLDMRALLAFARDTGGPALRRLTFHQRAELLKKLAQYLSERKDQLYQLSFLAGCTRSDSLIDVDGGIGTLIAYAGKGRRELPNATLPARRRRRAAVEGRQLCRPPHRHLAARRGGAYQRLQLPVLGTAGETGAGAARRRAGGDQARHRHLLCRACAGADDRRVEDPPRRRAAVHRRLHRRSVRSSDLPGRGVVHRLGRDLGEAAAPSGDRARSGALHRRAGFAQRRDPGAGCRAGHAGVRSVRQGSGEGDDGEGRAEMHRHPPRAGAGRALRRRDRGAARAACRR